jgi:hypothetical protein
MTQRRKSANRAHPGTCNWILSDAPYQKWLEMQCGLLWIKGNPGSGKSTIMAFLFEDMIRVSAERGQCNTVPKLYNYQLKLNESLKLEPRLDKLPPTDDRDIFVLSYFFHGRGSSLEKTQIGMFRSLLHQLLTTLAAEDPLDPICDKVSKAFLENSACGHGWEWQVEEVQRLFSETIMPMAKRQRVGIIVDALDEAGAEAANELLTHFDWLTRKMREAETEGRICISCRHYPVLEANIPGYTIALDGRNFKDIKSYVTQETELNIPTKNEHGKRAQKHVIETITSKAGSLFQWACLITPMAIRYHLDGESLDWIRQQLAKVPPGLSEVYQHIFTAIINKHDAHEIIAFVSMDQLGTKVIVSC